MLSDEWLSRYGLLENFNASVTRTGTGTGTGTHTGTGTWTTGVTAIALCTSCSRANDQENKWTNFENLRFCRSFFFFVFPGRDQYYSRLFLWVLLSREHPNAQPGGWFLLLFLVCLSGT